MTLTDYEGYFETLATNLVEIGHTEASPRFKMMELEEILSGGAAGLSYTNYCMTLDYYDSKLKGNDLTLMREYINGAFMIVKHVSPSELVLKRVVENESKVIAKQVIKQMIEDHRKSVLFGLLPNFEIRFIGPVIDSCYGTRVEFQMVKHFNFTNDVF